MVVLDATAGNRVMWHNKSPPLTVFMDRETRLAVPPDVFGDFRFCPFRDKAFDCVIFDPPYYVRGDSNWMFDNPDLTKSFGGKRPASHYGVYKSRMELLTNISNGVKEFSRISNRLCFQWGEGFLSLWRVLSLFKPWKEVFRRSYRSKGYQRKAKTSWTTFVLPPKQ